MMSIDIALLTLSLSSLLLLSLWVWALFFFNIYLELTMFLHSHRWVDSHPPLQLGSPLSGQFHKPGVVVCRITPPPGTSIIS